MRGRQINSAFLNNANKDKNVVSFKTKYKTARAEGTLNLSSCLPPLQFVPKEVFQLDAFIEEDEKFWEVVPLTSVDLSFNKITELTSEIGNLDCASLKMRSNLLQSLPEELFACPNVRHLDFDSNRISFLPEEMSRMICLKELILSNNMLRQVPETLFQLASLLRLELQNNQLIFLSSPGREFSRWNLASILHLNVANNKLSQLPESISNLLHLEILYCQSNTLTGLPELSRLHSLKFLDASQNQLTRFPILPQGGGSGRTFKGKLVHVYLGYNQISDLDVSGLLAHASTLSELMVHNNRLVDVPSDLETLGALKVLDVSNNNIRDLPAALGWMAGLQRMKVDGNSIKSIRQSLLTGPMTDLKTYLRTRGPSTLATPMQSDSSNSVADQIQFRLRDVTGGVLDLSGLSLVALPSSVVSDMARLPAFSTLHTLNLSNNSLADIPREVVEFSTVKVLLLNNNKLVEMRSDGRVITGRFSSQQQQQQQVPLFSSGLCSLDVSLNRMNVEQLDAIVAHLNPRSLTTLLVNNNSLPRLSLHLNQLFALRVLRASYCGLVSIEELDFSALPCLETLDLSNNKLETLGSSLFEEGCGRYLEYLSVENNCFLEVPAELARLPSLQVLLIGGNPQRTIRSAVVLQGSAKVLELLRNKLMDGSAPPAPLPASHSFNGQQRALTSSSAGQISQAKSSYRPQPTIGRSVSRAEPDNSLSMRRAASSMQPPVPPSHFAQQEQHIQHGQQTAGHSDNRIADRTQRSQVLKSTNLKRFNAPGDST